MPPTDRKPPRRRRKESRPAEIIEAALAEFAAKGFAAARLEDVARRAGVSKATIYVYFADKQALFEACMTSRVGQVMSVAAAQVETYPGSMADFLRQLLTLLHVAMRDSGTQGLLRMIIAESATFPALAEFHYRNNAARAKTLLTMVIRRGIDTGEFREGAYEAVPALLLGPGLMTAIWTMLFDKFDPLDADQALAAHIDLVISGLRKH